MLYYEKYCGFGTLRNNYYRIVQKFYTRTISNSLSVIYNYDYLNEF